MLSAPFASTSGRSLSDQNTRENLLNMYVEKVPGGRGQIIRRQRPGLKKNFTLSGEARGIQKLLGNDYCVVGNGFYRLSTTEAFRLGTLDTDSGKVTFAENTNQIAICDGFSLYCWDGTSLSKTTTPLAAIGSVASLDGYAVFNDRNSGKFYRTNLNDFKTVDSLNFATAESQPDKLVRTFVDHREIWLAGETSIEVWYNAGSTGFSFQRVSGVAIERGCAAANSFAAEDNTVFWLGNDGWVYRAQQYQPIRISDEDCERLIADAAPWTDAYGWVYSIPGHKFYVLTFPGRLTIAYDITTGLWSQCKTWESNSWDVVGPVKLGPQVVLAHGGGCQLVADLNTDNAGIMQREAIAPPVYADGDRLQIDAYWLDVEVGTSTSTTSPSIMLSVSRDGQTFGNVRTRGLGAVGDHRRRAVWRNLGIGRSFTFKLSVTDDAPFTVVEGRMQAKKLQS